MKHQVSIVIIGRNEERSLGKCLAAAQAAAEQIGGAEIIFVDSASTDNTVAVAQSYGVRVLSLKPDWQLCPSAGRFVGSHYAEGDFILFVDADTLVYRDFLPVALKFFEQNPEIGGINGFLDDLDEEGKLLENAEERFEEPTNVKWLRGPCCFYRKQSLSEAGSFNPYLAMEEEAELGLRLVKKGWKLLQIPVSMACHTRCYHCRTVKSVITTFKRDIVSKRLGEITKTMAYAFKEGNGLIFCWLRLKTTIIFFAWLFLLALSLLLPESFYPKTIFSLLAVLPLLAIFGKKRSVSQTLLFIPAKVINFIDVLSGFHKISFKNTAFYPLDVIEHQARIKHN